MSTSKSSEDPDVRREVQTILGYYELAMWDEALAEAADAEARIGPRFEFDELRVAILQEAKRWGEMRAIAERCAREEPTRSSWFIAWAYALRREKSIAEARPVLELALSLHPNEALIPFNLACYTAQGGRLAEALAFVEQAIKLDPDLRKQAERDPDLAPLWAEKAKGKGKAVKPSKGTKEMKAVPPTIESSLPPPVVLPSVTANPPAAKSQKSEKPEKSPEKASNRKKEKAVSPLAEALYAVTQRLIAGDSTTRAKALHALVESKAEAILVAMLALEEPGLAPLAMRGLWECWLNEEGPEARTQIERGISRLDKADYAAAEQVFAGLIGTFPRWAEPVNKLATVYYLEKRYEESLALCRQVVGLKEDHFAAWQGMTLCAVQMEDWKTALEAARQSLRLQPQNAAHRELVCSLEAKLAEGN